MVEIQRDVAVLLSSNGKSYDLEEKVDEGQDITEGAGKQGVYFLIQPPPCS